MIASAQRRVPLDDGYLGRILSSIPCGLGYFWMLWDKQTWHDKLATSVVVPESYYPISSA